MLSNLSAFQVPSLVVRGVHASHFARAIAVPTARPCMPPRPYVRRVLRRISAYEDDSMDPLASVDVCPVPEEQQPVQELKALQDSLLFNWATLPVPDFAIRLASVWMVFLLTLGLPVSAVTFNINSQPVECFVSASIGSLFIVSVVVIRLYLGFAHVGNRLLSATVEYEESGWYDGQIWVKTPAILLRDRLLGTYSVKPALQRLRYTLVSLAGIMASSALLLLALPPPPANSFSSSSSSSATESTYSYTMAERGSGSSEEYWQRVQCYEPWAVDGARAADDRTLALGQHSNAACSLEQ